MLLLSRNNEIICLIGLTNFDGRNIELHGAIFSRGLTRNFIIACGFRVFEELKCERLYAKVQPDGKASKLCAQLGFKVEGRLRQSASYGDQTLLSMIREDYEWAAQRLSRSNSPIR